MEAYLFLQCIKHLSTTHLLNLNQLNLQGWGWVSLYTCERLGLEFLNSKRLGWNEKKYYNMT